MKRWLLACLTFLSAFGAWAGSPAEWEAAAGYQIQIDSSNWSFPVAIQFVSQPGSGPKAPLYYVSELRGRIKVVTNDRSVLTYADAIEDLRPEKELPELKAEFGLTGLCLDEANGQIYATTVYRKGAQLFNKILRFGSPDKKLGVSGQKNWEMVELFSHDRSGPSHQIGHCIISRDRKLYVGVGDAHEHYKAQLLDHPNGKILRMNLDGTAPSDNPFYNAKTPTSIPSYVYAYGMRNPFALAEGPEGGIYVAESGPKIDRLLKLAPGRNYLWNGKDESMLLNGMVTWPEALGPATMVYLSSHPRFPQWSHRLLITASIKAYIEMVWIDAETGAKAPPEVIVRYKGDQEKTKQYLVPVAVGPDGIYFSGFLPQSDGQTHIMKMIPATTTTTNTAPLRLSGEALFAQLECRSCHSLSGSGGKIAPALDNLVPRLREHLNSSEYREQLKKVDALTEEVFVQTREVRQRLQNLTGDEKIAAWISARLREPRFDMPDSQMPKFDLNEEQIQALTQYLMKLTAEDRRQKIPAWKRWGEDAKFYLTTHVEQGLLIMLGVGLGLGWFLRTLVGWLGFPFRKTRR